MDRLRRRRCVVSQSAHRTLACQRWHDLQRLSLNPSAWCDDPRQQYHADGVAQPRAYRRLHRGERRVAPRPVLQIHGGRCAAGADSVLHTHVSRRGRFHLDHTSERVPRPYGFRALHPPPDGDSVKCTTMQSLEHARRPQSLRLLTRESECTHRLTLCSTCTSAAPAFSQENDAVRQ